MTQPRKCKTSKLKKIMPNEKRAMAKERSRRFREKKRLNVLKSVHHVVSLLPCDLKHTLFLVIIITGLIIIIDFN